MITIQAFIINICCILMLCTISCGLECYTNTNIDDSGPVIITKKGTIVGKYVKVLDKESAAFLGIPFAKPPVGEKRFQISEPIDEWTGTLLAKEKSPACMQYSSRKEIKWVPPSTFNYDEDCLYLNVWLPPNCCCNREDKLPVMAFIHGGGYYSGTAMMDTYDGEVLATLGEVIVVTFNYRLGIFGFLNARSKEAPGNMGLFDQLFALQWIHKNIADFGGDPNSVTLFGESAGGFSVTLQMISSLPRNLFHKAIIESGTSAQPLTVDNHNSSLSKAMQFSKFVGCSLDHSDLSRSILLCLQGINSTKLAIAENYFTSKFPAFFTPVYGNECEECMKYFSESPTKTIQSGTFYQIPTLIGNNKDEGTLFMVYTIPRLFSFNHRPLLTIPEAKHVLQDFFGIVQLSSIPSDDIFIHYLKNITQNDFDAPLSAVSNVYADFLIRCASMIFADNAKDVYYYIFSHRSKNDKDDEWVGVPHFAEIPYVFGHPFKQFKSYTSEDRKKSKEVIEAFTSFAYNGYPTIQDSELNWPKYSSSDRKVYEISSKRNRIIEFPDQEACLNIWKPIFFQ